MRDGFILHEKTMAQIAKLSNEQAGEFLKAMIAHYKGDEHGEVSQIVDVLMVDAAERMDRDRDSYEELAKKRSTAGQKGAEKRWHSDGKAMANDSKAMANDGESVSVSVSDIKENSPSESKRKVFRKPTVEEVREYCSSRGNTVDPEAFVDFYESKGWRVGNQPMKDWKACVRTWEKKRQQRPPNKVTKFDRNIMQRAGAEKKQNDDMIRQILEMR